MPLVSDPGYVLVQGCVAAGLAVEVLPGPRAALAALVASALPADALALRRLPAAQAGGAASRCSASPETVVAFESPRRVGATLAVLAELDPERPVAVCRELTKLHEEVVRGTAARARRALRRGGPARRGRARLRRRAAARRAPTRPRSTRCGGWSTRARRRAAGRGRRRRAHRRGRQRALPRGRRALGHAPAAGLDDELHQQLVVPPAVGAALAQARDADLAEARASRRRGSRGRCAGQVVSVIRWWPRSSIRWRVIARIASVPEAPARARGWRAGCRRRRGGSPRRAPRRTAANPTTSPSSSITHSSTVSSSPGHSAVCAPHQRITSGSSRMAFSGARSRGVDRPQGDPVAADGVHAAVATRRAERGGARLRGTATNSATEPRRTGSRARRRPVRSGACTPPSSSPRSSPSAPGHGSSPPVPGEVVRAFAYAGDPFARGHHRGLDLAAAPGAPVRAACSGRVTFAGRAGASGRAVDGPLRRVERHPPAAARRRRRAPASTSSRARRSAPSRRRARPRRPAPRRPPRERPARLRRPGAAAPRPPRHAPPAGTRAIARRPDPPPPHPAPLPSARPRGPRRRRRGRARPAPAARRPSRRSHPGPPGPGSRCCSRARSARATARGARARRAAPARAARGAGTVSP